MQKVMMKLRRRHIRSKIRTEQLKQALLREKLERDLIDIPELEPSSESETDDDYEDE